MLHITNGHAAMGVMRQAGVSGDILLWCDVLHEGPVPDGISERELRRIRARFLSNSDADSQHILADVERSVSRLDNRDSREDVILWFEHDLFDQLNLIQLLDHFAQCGAPSANVSVICINQFPGHPEFKGLGELQPEELTTLWDRRQPLTARECDVAHRAWSAFRASDPRAIEKLFSDDLTPLPFLEAALRRHLEEFPAKLNGLSRTETRLLDILRSGPQKTSSVFPRMHGGERAFYIGDLSFWKVVVELASFDPSFVMIDGDAYLQDRRLPNSMLAITSTGHQALEGAIDRIATHGIDRWLGGVHLSGRGPV